MQEPGKYQGRVSRELIEHANKIVRMEYTALSKQCLINF